VSGDATPCAVKPHKCSPKTLTGKFDWMDQAVSLRQPGAPCKRYLVQQHDMLVVLLLILIIIFHHVTLVSFSLSSSLSLSHMHVCSGRWRLKLRSPPSMVRSFPLSFLSPFSLSCACVLVLISYPSFTSSVSHVFSFVFCCVAYRCFCSQLFVFASRV
jgi:hypothetical protein